MGLQTADHRQLSPMVCPVLQLTCNPFIQSLPVQLGYKDAMGDGVKHLAEVRQNDNKHSSLFYWTTHFIADGYHASRAWFVFDKIMVTYATTFQRWQRKASQCCWWAPSAPFNVAHPVPYARFAYMVPNQSPYSLGSASFPQGLPLSTGNREPESKPWL